MDDQTHEPTAAEQRAAAADLKAKSKEIGKVQTYDPFTATWRDATADEASLHAASPSVQLPADES